METHRGAVTTFLTLGLVAGVGWLIWQAGKNVEFKGGVNSDGVKAPVWFALGVADFIYALFGAKLTVTSLTDSKHAVADSLHYTGNAADLRINGIAGDVVQKIYAKLKSALTWSGFDVVLESDHIHMEYDPKPGRSLSWFGGK